MRTLKFIIRLALWIILMNAFFLSDASAQINPSLKKRLDSIYLLDQKYRTILQMMTNEAKADSLAKLEQLTVEQISDKYWALQTALDSSNLVFIKEVFRQYAYPGLSLVGEGTNAVAWNIIQHIGETSKYLPMVKKAALQNQIPFYLYAMMLDRYLMECGRKQIWGSQGACRLMKTGDKKCFIWPVKKPHLVDKRRRRAGFKTGIAENAELLGIIYRKVKIKEFL